MSIKVNSSVAATILISILFGLELRVSAQEAKPPTPTPAPGETITDKEKTNKPKTDPLAAAAFAAAMKPTQAPAAATPTPPKPPEDVWHRAELTGDWGGGRSKLKEKGVELEFSLTQFFQGIATGGLENESGHTEYNGVFTSNFKFDFGKLAGWKFWSAQIQTETRFGGPPLGGIGTINPVNTAAIIPGPNNTIFSVTAVNVTRLFPIDLPKGKLIALSFGRFNMLDLLDEDFFGGNGVDRFWNIAGIGPLTVLRQVPLITNLVSVAYIKGGEPFITFALLDPNDQSLQPGLGELFKDGVTLSPGINFSTKYWGKSGKHTIGGAVTTKAYTPFDAIRQVVIPGPAINPVEPQRGSFSVNYDFRQYIVERAKRDGWGVYAQVSFADKDTSPVTVFFNVGLGGNGLFSGRRGDEFGIGYAYTDLSEVLKDNIDLITIGNRRLQPEHQVEMFYNLHITPWLQLTGDLQVIRPTRPIADTAVVPGVRLKMVF